MREEFDGLLKECVLALTYAVLGANKQMTAYGRGSDVDSASAQYVVDEVAAARAAICKRDCASKIPSYRQFRCKRCSRVDMKCSSIGLHSLMLRGQMQT